MAGKTVTRSDLSEIVYNTVGLSRSESAQIVETVLDEISDALIRGEDVKLSSFGSFLVRHKNGRIGRNPKTGEEVPIEPRRVLSFRASHVLKEKINKMAASAKNKSMTSGKSENAFAPLARWPALDVKTACAALLGKQI